MSGGNVTRASAEPDATRAASVKVMPETTLVNAVTAGAICTVASGGAPRPALSHCEGSLMEGVAKIPPGFVDGDREDLVPSLACLNGLPVEPRLLCDG